MSLWPRGQGRGSVEFKPGPSHGSSSQFWTTWGEDTHGASTQTWSRGALVPRAEVIPKISQEDLD
jgi:hypothetical protein